MHQFVWLSERGGNLLNFLKKEGGTQKGGEISLRKWGAPNLEETTQTLQICKETPFPGLRWAIIQAGLLIKFFSCKEGHSFKGSVHLGWGTF